MISRDCTHVMSLPGPGCPGQSGQGPHICVAEDPVAAPGSHLMSVSHYAWSLHTCQYYPGVESSYWPHLPDFSSPQTCTGTADWGGCLKYNARIKTSFLIFISPVLLFYNDGGGGGGGGTLAGWVSCLCGLIPEHYFGDKWLFLSQFEGSLDVS